MVYIVAGSASLSQPHLSNSDHSVFSFFTLEFPSLAFTWIRSVSVVHLTKQRDILPIYNLFLWPDDVLIYFGSSSSLESCVAELVRVRQYQHKLTLESPCNP